MEQSCSFICAVSAAVGTSHSTTGLHFSAAVQPLDPLSDRFSIATVSLYTHTLTVARSQHLNLLDAGWLRYLLAHLQYHIAVYHFCTTYSAQSSGHPRRALSARIGTQGRADKRTLSSTFWGEPSLRRQQALHHTTPGVYLHPHTPWLITWEATTRGNQRFRTP